MKSLRISSFKVTCDVLKVFKLPSPTTRAITKIFKTSWFGRIRQEIQLPSENFLYLSLQSRCIFYPSKSIFKTRPNSDKHDFNLYLYISFHQRSLFVLRLRWHFSPCRFLGFLSFEHLVSAYLVPLLVTLPQSQSFSQVFLVVSYTVFVSVFFHLRISYHWHSTDSAINKLRFTQRRIRTGRIAWWDPCD